MFRTILVHLQEQLYKLYIAFGICRYMLIRVAVVWLYTYQHIPNAMTAYKVAPDDGLIWSETCRASIGSLITRILCILLVYIHIVR